MLQQIIACPALVSVQSFVVSVLSFFAIFFFFFFNDPATTEIYTLSLHDALPILRLRLCVIAALLLAASGPEQQPASKALFTRSEEHTSELQSRRDLVCRLLLEKKKKIKPNQHSQDDHKNYQHSQQY